MSKVKNTSVETQLTSRMAAAVWAAIALAGAIATIGPLEIPGSDISADAGFRRLRRVLRGSDVHPAVVAAAALRVRPDADPDERAHRGARVRLGRRPQRADHPLHLRRRARRVVPAGARERRPALCDRDHADRPAADRGTRRDHAARGAPHHDAACHPRRAVRARARDARDARGGAARPAHEGLVPLRRRPAQSRDSSTPRSRRSSRALRVTAGRCHW